MQIETIWESPDGLGEGPIWHADEQVLYWLDILKPSLKRLNPATGEYREWPIPEHIGSVVPRAQGGLVATMGNRVVAIDMPSGTISTLVEVPQWRDDIRMNDGKCDRKGRYWFGVANLSVEDPKGRLYRLDPDGTLTQMEEKITISNGLGWSPDNKKFYYTDGLKYRIYQYDYDLERGDISNRQTFIQLDKTPIEPDGLTVDSEGYVWDAQWNSWKILRYSPDGKMSMEIEMPVQRPTSCIFGGPNLDILYVTSSSQNLGEDSVLPPPAGGLFAIDVGVRGLPEPAFTG